MIKPSRKTRNCWNLHRSGGYGEIEIRFSNKREINAWESWQCIDKIAKFESKSCSNGNLKWHNQRIAIGGIDLKNNCLFWPKLKWDRSPWLSGCWQVTLQHVDTWNGVEWLELIVLVELIPTEEFWGKHEVLFHTMSVKLQVRKFHVLSSWLSAI